MESIVASPAIAFVGRHNSGKTTLIEALIAELTTRGVNVGSIKHHSHAGFEIDIPGKDSYRHKHAGSTDTIIACPGQVARVMDVEGEVECSQLVRQMPGHDIVIVEGYRKSGLPTFEIMRAGNPADENVARVFLEASLQGRSLNEDSIQAFRDERKAKNGESSDSQAQEADIASKMPTAATVAVVTDIPEAIEAAGNYDLPVFGLNDIEKLTDYVQMHYVRQEVTVAIQAGGESRRMGRSKATVPFAGKPLITRIVSRVSPVADRILITTNEPENLKFLHDEFPELDITLVTDEFNERGALPGLCTALKAATTPLVALVACDMVFASAGLIAEEALEIQALDADVVVPVNKHGFEPFHAMYRRGTCLTAVQEKLAQGEKRAQSFFPMVKVAEFSQERVLEAEPSGGCFQNANTPDDLAFYERVVVGE